MKVGDAVWVSKKKDKIGVLLSMPKRKIMVGNIADVLIGGRIRRVLAENIEVVKVDPSLSESTKCTLIDDSTQLDQYHSQFRRH